MRQDVVKAIQDFEEEGAVLFSKLDESTWVLVPKMNGCPVVFQDMGDAVCMRTGLDLEVIVDYEEEDSIQLVYEAALSLMNGNSVEFLAGVYRDRLSPCGYKVDFPGGSMEELGGGKKKFTVRLPPWNK